MNKWVKNTIDQIDAKIEKLKATRSQLVQLSEAVESFLDDRPTRGTLKNRTKRAVNESSLGDHVRVALGKFKKGLTLQELADTVLEAGYKTNSKAFKGVLYQCVHNMSLEVQRDDETMKYTLIK